MKQVILQHCLRYMRKSLIWQEPSLNPGEKVKEVITPPPEGNMIVCSKFHFQSVSKQFSKHFTDRRQIWSKVSGWTKALDWETGTSLLAWLKKMYKLQVCDRTSSTATSTSLPSTLLNNGNPTPGISAEPWTERVTERELKSDSWKMYFFFPAMWDPSQYSGYLQYCSPKTCMIILIRLDYTLGLGFVSGFQCVNEWCSCVLCVSRMCIYLLPSLG